MAEFGLQILYTTTGSDTQLKLSVNQQTDNYTLNQITDPNSIAAIKSLGMDFTSISRYDSKNNIDYLYLYDLSTDLSNKK